jgi:MYXO-CTERM domain-containing protein
MRRRVSAALALLPILGVLAAVAGPAAPSATAAAFDRFYANFQGEELMRAINADRHALGLPALAASPVLAAAAREKAVTCPSDPGITIRGRARDMAERGYLAHDIPGCADAGGGTFTTFDLLTEVGVTWTLVGENIARNTYPSSETGYSTGCSASGSGCNGSISLPWNVAVTEKGWMSSSTHRSTMLSTTFTRFGCGAWDAASGTHVYSCYFTAGGNAGTDGTPPAIGDPSGVGAVYATGSSPSFTAAASDAGSLLADGTALLDGKIIRDWAYDHAGGSASLTVTAPPLTAGAHRLTWQVRDTSTNVRTITVDFSAAGSPPAGTPAPTPARTPAPTPARTATPTAAPTPGPGATPARTPTPTTGAPASTTPPAAHANGSVVPSTAAPSPEPSSEFPSATPGATGPPSPGGTAAGTIARSIEGDQPPSAPAVAASFLASTSGDGPGWLLAALALAALAAAWWWMRRRPRVVRHARRR